MSDRHVLLVSTIADVATDDVTRRLSARGTAFTRINTEDYPFAKTLSFIVGQSAPCAWLANDGRAMQRPVWYRRMRTPPRPEAMDGGVYEFCLHETRATYWAASWR